MSDLIGQDVGRYHIIEQLGQGGMATVFRAHDARLEREVALKFIRREEIGSAYMEQLLKRFEREAKSLAQLSHPNIVKVHDYGDHEGVPYLVMEYLPGGTLKERLGKPMLPAEAARLLVPIARALAYAHQEHIIHRDVKPANILITRSGEPMLTDFGIAKILDQSGDGATALTSTGVGMGTPDYMAPEQWTNQVTPQTDVYALGVVFFEMVTGRRPFTADTPAAVLIKQAQDPLPRPKLLVPSLPDAVEQILYKALAKSPAERYPTMAAFADALEGLRAGGAETTHGLAATPSAPGARPQRGAARGRPWLWVAIGAVGLGALVIVALAAFGVWYFSANSGRLDAGSPGAVGNPGAGLQSEPAVNVVFCDRPCSQAGANHQTSFPPTSDVYLNIQFRGMNSGDAWSRSWSNQQETWIADEDCHWKAASGTLSLHLNVPGGLRAGLWTVTITSAGHTYTGSFTVTGDNTNWKPNGTVTCKD